MNNKKQEKKIKMTEKLKSAQPVLFSFARKIHQWKSVLILNRISTLKWNERYSLSLMSS